MHAKLQLAFWIAHPALELTLAVIMVWRKLSRTFPVFFAYILFQLFNFGIMFPIHQSGNYDLYFYSYWIGSGISLAIGFKVIHEIFLNVFRPYHTLKDLGTVLFKWAALVMLFVAIVVAAASPADSSPIVQAVTTVERCVRVIQCGLVLFLLFFSRYLGVSWRQHSFGIILGFGGFASVELAAIALYGGGQINVPLAGLVNAAAYTLAILTWVGYTLQKAPARDASLGLLTSQRWERSLADLQRPTDPDSLIPMFEGMVDRAFSRTSPESGHELRAVEELAEKVSASRHSLPAFSAPELTLRR
jgi:hypothetical protein